VPDPFRLPGVVAQLLLDVPFGTVEGPELETAEPPATEPVAAPELEVPAAVEPAAPPET
jgi:hypothetical protein